MVYVNFLNTAFDVECDDVIINGIVAGNFLVFLLWVYLNYSERFSEDGEGETETETPHSMGSVMRRYFINYPGHPLPSLLLSAFSHKHILHLYMNMAAMSSVAPIVIRLHGCLGFLTIYVAGAVVSSVGCIQIRNMFGRPLVKSLGASGAVLTLLGVIGSSPEFRRMGFFVSPLDLVYPHPIPAIVLCQLFLAVDVVGFFIDRSGFIDHANHISGMLFGLLLFRSIKSYPY